MKIITLLLTRASPGIMLSGLALLGACTYTRERIPEPACTSLPTVVSYKTNVLPILQAKCYRCHSAANYNTAAPNGSGGALNMESFADLKTWTQPTGGGPSYVVGSMQLLPGYNAMPSTVKTAPMPAKSPPSKLGLIPAHLIIKVLWLTHPASAAPPLAFFWV